jgi:hypothetical protein
MSAIAWGTDGSAHNTREKMASTCIACGGDGNEPDRATCGNCDQPICDKCMQDGNFDFVCEECGMLVCHNCIRSLLLSLQYQHLGAMCNNNHICPTCVLDTKN